MITFCFILGCIFLMVSNEHILPLYSENNPGKGHFNKTEEDKVCHHMRFGLKILEVGLLHPRHGLVVVQVLAHLHVLRVAHEEGVCCCYCFLQLVYLRAKHKTLILPAQSCRSGSKRTVHSKQEISAFLSLPLRVPQKAHLWQELRAYQRLSTGPWANFQLFPKSG